MRATSRRRLRPRRRDLARGEALVVAAKRRSGSWTLVGESYRPSQASTESRPSASTESRRPSQASTEPRRGLRRRLRRLTPCRRVCAGCGVDRARSAALASASRTKRNEVTKSDATARSTRATRARQEDERQRGRGRQRRRSGCARTSSVSTRSLRRGGAVVRSAKCASFRLLR